MLLMPIFNQNSSKFSYNMALDGVIYYFNFYFNTREEAWYMDIADANKNIIRAGFKMVVGYFLLKRWKSYPVPKGEFIVLNSANVVTVPLGFASLGNQFQLFYITAAELAAGVVTGVQ